MRAARAYQRIDQNTAVLAGDPIDLVLLLYDKLIQRINEALRAIELADVAARGEAIGKAIDLIEKGLVASLDMAQGGEVARQCKRQYATWLALLLKASAESDPRLLSLVASQVREIADSWKQVKAMTSNLRT